MSFKVQKLMCGVGCTGAAFPALRLHIILRCLFLHDSGGCESAGPCCQVSISVQCGLARGL